VAEQERLARRPRFCRPPRLLYSRIFDAIEVQASIKAAAATSTANVSVLSVTPANAGRLFALASIEIEVDGVVIALHGIRAMRVGTESTRIELPQYRDASGLQRPVVTLPPEVYGPIGNAVLDTLVERGLASRRAGSASSLDWFAHSRSRTPP
jgi:hypothetical protein